jgi:hypothetical protein
VGVVDLLQLSGRPPLADDHAQQVLVLGESLKVSSAILISRAFGIRNLKDLTPLESAVGQQASWEQARYRDIDGVALTELNLRELAASPAFVAIGV